MLEQLCSCELEHWSLLHLKHMETVFHLVSTICFTQSSYTLLPAMIYDFLRYSKLGELWPNEICTLHCAVPSYSSRKYQSLSFFVVCLSKNTVWRASIVQLTGWNSITTPTFVFYASTPLLSVSEALIVKKERKYLVHCPFCVDKGLSTISFWTFFI